MKKRLLARRYNKLERLAWYVGNEYRTIADEVAMERLFKELRKAGIQTGWEPTPRKSLND